MILSPPFSAQVRSPVHPYVLFPANDLAGHCFKHYVFSFHALDVVGCDIDGRMDNDAFAFCDQCGRIIHLTPDQVKDID